MEVAIDVMLPQARNGMLAAHKSLKRPGMDYPLDLPKGGPADTDFDPKSLYTESRWNDLPCHCLLLLETFFLWLSRHHCHSRTSLAAPSQCPLQAPLPIPDS